LTFTKTYFDNSSMSVSIVFNQNQSNNIEQFAQYLPGQPAHSVCKQRVGFDVRRSGKVFGRAKMINVRVLVNDWFIQSTGAHVCM
jgi:hypothetical protein